jgi:DNA replication protein DnaC
VVGHPAETTEAFCDGHVRAFAFFDGVPQSILYDNTKIAAEGVDHPRYLMRLAEMEMIDRERRMEDRRIKATRFPTVNSLDSFDFLALPSLNKMLVLELARSDYVERRENIIAVGNSGTGKSHIPLGLGLAACQKGLSVGFITASALVHELLEARDEKRLLRLQRQLAG